MWKRWARECIEINLWRSCFWFAVIYHHGGMLMGRHFSRWVLRFNHEQCNIRSTVGCRPRWWAQVLQLLLVEALVAHLYYQIRCMVPCRRFLMMAMEIHRGHKVGGMQAHLCWMELGCMLNLKEGSSGVQPRNEHPRVAQGDGIIQL